MKGMDQESEISDSRPETAGAGGEVSSLNFVPYESSPGGKYSRWILLLLAVSLVAWFGYRIASRQTGTLGFIAASILLTTLVTLRGNRILRVGLLVAMAMNVFSQVVNPDELFSKLDTSFALAARYVLLGCLVAASIFETSAWVKSSPRKTLVKTLAWSVLAIPAIGYIAGIPILNSVWEAIAGDEKTIVPKNPDWNLLNEVSFRAAKFFVFTAFTYLGACLGSFLNVVAYCAPRGEAIGMRNSQCPKCDSEISRIDNLPIFSYINLGAKCRNCSSHIPARYLIVELIVAAIFGSLFLYELVTGCANVPATESYFHKGVLWIILYPKWPVIGIYFYHCFFMSAVLVLSLIEWDKQPIKLNFSIFVWLVFFVSGVIYFPTQPAPLLEHVPGISLQLSPLIEQLSKLVFGGAMGALMGWLAGRAFLASHATILTFAFSLTGMVLGWQALIQVAIFFVVLSALARGWSKSATLLLSKPTTILLIAIALHHPFWNAIAGLWRFN